MEVTLASDAKVNVQGNTHNGDIVTDFALAVSGDENKTVSGTIGSGGPKVYLSAENGDIRIKRGSEVSSAPPVPVAPPAHNAPHLKAPKGTATQPVTQ